MSSPPPLNTKQSIRCPKCNGDQIGMRYCEAKTLQIVVSGHVVPCPTVPHMHRDRQRCKYVWFEAPYQKTRGVKK